ncbi:MAG: hypothetical protein JW806_08330 [Sedimentisphaerales bacterium]|nr:hypothetical protein [Sedimentisphaerales bacterium]
MKRILLLSVIVVIFSLLYFTSDVFAVDGWASMNGGTTGGEGGTVVTVSTPEDFNNYITASGPYIVQVSGTIDLSSIGYMVHIASDKTIKGIGLDSLIIGDLSFQQYASNVIIRDLSITNPTSGEDNSDGIAVKENISNVYITQCTLYDCGDGCIDITEESDYVTVSWCKFYYVSQLSHRFPNLIGHNDTNYDDRGHLRVTMHHNWYSDLCTERMPRVRFGQVHVYNNYYGCAGNNYCIGVGVESNIRVENNYFDNVNQTWYNWSNSGTPGIIGWNTGAVGNQFVNGTTPATWATNNYVTVFTPPYSYTMDDGPDVKDIVMAGAGHIVTDAIPPDAPTGLAAISSESIISLDWDDNSEPDLAGYNVYRSETSGTGYVQINSTLVTNSDYIDNIISNGVTYYYVVSAVDTALNESDDSTEVSAIGIDTTPPAAPTGLAASASDSMVALDWDDNNESDIEGYNVYRSTTHGAGFVQINSVLVTSSDYIDNTVVNGTTYYYVVTAEDISANESGNSNEASAEPYDQLTAADFESDFGDWINVIGDDYDWFRNSGPTPSASTGPSSGANGSNWYVYFETSSGYANIAGDTAYLEGPDIEGVNRQLSFYYHMYGAHIGTLYVDVYNGVWNEGVWSISGQQHDYPEDPYTRAIVDLSGFIGTIRIRFRAVAAGGYQGDIAIDDIEIVEDLTDTTPPAPPTGLTAILPGETDVPLEWNANTEVDLAGYNLYRSQTSGAGFVRQNVSLIVDSNYIDDVINHYTTYYYVVTALDTTLNESSYSNEVFGGLYGDFTGNGIVEINDLPDLLDFWLEDDCNTTDGLDLDDNCIVNFYEFSVLANNWLQ